MTNASYARHSDLIFQEKCIFRKLDNIEEAVHRALLGHADPRAIPELPGRDAQYLPVGLLPKRKGLSQNEGKERLLHDLANIELQAMELGLRTLVEYPWAPYDFKEQLAAIILEEAKHLKSCLQGLEHLGSFWGKYPVHLGLWDAAHSKDSLLERVFVVHRYLESSGLDAGDTLLRKLTGINTPVLDEIVKVIVDEEVGHVDFGSRWFKVFCHQQGVHSHHFFYRKTLELLVRHPRKDKISRSLRRQGGYSEQEIGILESARDQIYTY